jgi:hypothetical protein
MNQIEQMQEWIDHHSKRADKAEAVSALLLDALVELVDAIEDGGGHDENGDVFDIRKACAAIDIAMEGAA